MNWSCLQKPGRNRIQLLIILLVWWGKASDWDGSWLAVVVDVTDVLTWMQKASEGTLVHRTPEGNPLGGSSTANAATPVTFKRGCWGEPLNKRQKVCWLTCLDCSILVNYLNVVVYHTVKTKCLAGTFNQDWSHHACCAKSILENMNFILYVHCEWGTVVI